MRAKYMFLLCLGLTFFLNENLLKAAQIDIHTIEKIVTIRLVGLIENGDAEKFQKLIEGLRQKKRAVHVLMLASSGGDANEAMRIGQIVRKSFISTHAPFTSDYGWTCNGYPPGLIYDDCDCASACFLIWVAGVYRMGDVLGIHRPYFLKEHLDGMSASEVQEEYDLMYENMRSYLENMDVPEHVINKMFNTEPDDIIYIDQNTVKSMKSPYFFDEFLRKGCLRLTSEEEKDYWRLLAKKWGLKSTLTKSEKIYFNYLRERKEKFNKCLRKKIREAQLEEKTTS